MESHSAVRVCLFALWISSLSSPNNASPKMQFMQKSALSVANENLWKETRREGPSSSAKNSFLPESVLAPIPGTKAESFSLFTLSGILKYPSPVFSNAALIFHSFDNTSAFLECLWTSSFSLSFVKNIPNNTNYIFIPTSTKPSTDAKWMQQQVFQVIDESTTDISQRNFLKSKFHFVTLSTAELGNWIPSVFRDWACQDHGCGIAQALFSGSDHESPIVLKRLDARYDWLPSPEVIFKDKPNEVIYASTGCQKSEGVAHKIALVEDGECSFSEKVSTMESSGATGVIVHARPGEPVQDMNCVDQECDAPPSIPACFVPYDEELIQRIQQVGMNVSFQTSPSNNFYFAIDAQGYLAEFGWMLYPSFQFFNWQAEWFNYKTQLLANLSQSAVELSVFNATIMKGNKGAVATVALPDLREFDLVQLDASLSCPGTSDETCPPWDHTVHLYVCCNSTSPACNQELGRWITPFRRRIGRWLTDVSPLKPLMDGPVCNFTMKTVPWAQAWKPSLNLRFTRKTEQLKPYKAVLMFRGGTFNKSYNANYKPFIFSLAADVKKVQIVSVITGHGSDENGCGEFCVTSHHFVVNEQFLHNNTFSNAGTALGCANRVPTGVEPNEHGTWLYGRDGWCDGRQVDPWVLDITQEVKIGSLSNSIKYFGWFQGKDPNPKSQPGYIIMYSYLVLYR